MANRDFYDCMVDTLLAYSEWIDANANYLARVMSEGCTEWSLIFSWDGGSSEPPRIRIESERVSKDIIYKFNGLGDKTEDD